MSDTLKVSRYYIYYLPFPNLGSMIVDRFLHCNIVRIDHRVPNAVVRKVCAALNAAEAGRTVRAKRPVQQRKVSTVRKSCVNCGNKDFGCFNDKCRRNMLSAWKLRTAKTVA